MEPKELTLSEIAGVIIAGKKLIAKIVIPTTIFALIVSFLLPKWYKATTVIMPPASESSNLGAAGLLGQFGLGNLIGSGADASRFLAILKSQRLLIALNNKYNFQQHYETENLEETLKILEDNLNIELGEENQINISFLDTDQDLVAEKTNYIVYCLDSLNISLFTSQASNNRQFISSQVNIALDSLQLLENQIRNFMKEAGVLSLPDQISAGISAAAELRARIMSKEIELMVTQKILEPNNAQIIRLRLEINSLKEKYKEFYSDNTDEKLLLNLNNIPDLEIKYLRLKRQAEYYKKVLEFLAPQYEQAKIEAAKEIPTVQVLDRAIRPEKKDRPSKAKYVLVTFFLSLVFGIYMAYFQNRKIIFPNGK